MVLTIIPVAIHTGTDTDGTRSSLVLAGIVDVVSVIAQVGWTAFFVFHSWTNPDLEVGIGPKEVEGNYEVESKTWFFTSSVVFGTVFLALSIWYLVNVCIYKSYYDEEPAIVTYADYERMMRSKMKEKEHK